MPNKNKPEGGSDGHHTPDSGLLAQDEGAVGAVVDAHGDPGNARSV